MILSSLVTFIPIIGIYIKYITLAFIYSLNSFEYKWNYEYWPIKYKLEYFERHWIYFLGFGTPFAFLFMFLPYFISSGIYALLFPITIINASLAIPLRPNPLKSFLPERIPIFNIPIKMAVLIIRIYPYINHLRGKN